MTLGAVRAHRDGVVTACSVAGAGRELAHAAELLRGCPRLDVGVHLMLTGARPVTEPARVPSLVTRHGRFPAGYPEFVCRYALRRVSIREVEIELRAQIDRVLARGLPVRHLNGHQHLHVLPRVFDVVVRLALEYGVPYVRVPADRRPPGAPSRRGAAVAALGRLAGRAAAKARAAGLCVNHRTIGVTDAGHLTSAAARRLIPEIEGVTELVTHPGVGGRVIEQDHDWGYEWDAETEALCDAAVAADLARAGVSLTGVGAAFP